jgi:hypothetical protein
MISEPESPAIKMIGKGTSFTRAIKASSLIRLLAAEVGPFIPQWTPPQGLKPIHLAARYGTAEAVPFPNPRSWIGPFASSIRLCANSFNRVPAVDLYS